MFLFVVWIYQNEQEVRISVDDFENLEKYVKGHQTTLLWHKDFSQLDLFGMLNQLHILSLLSAVMC